MPVLTSQRRPLSWVLLLGCALAAPACRRPAAPGVAVQAVQERGAAAAAGVGAGDTLVSWRRARSGVSPAASGELRSPFDLEILEMEQAPRGAVSLAVRRGGEVHSVALGAGPWGITPRATPGAMPGLEACWLELAAGRAGAGARKWPEAQAALDEAEQCAKAAGRSDAVALVLDAQGDAFQAAGELHKAEQAYRRALTTREAAGGKSLAVAASLARLAELAHQRALERGAAEGLWRRSLALREELAAGSLDVAACHHGLGDVFHREGKLADAEQEHRKALAIVEALAPESLLLAETLAGLGAVAQYRGDLGAAEAFHRRALALKERLAPGSTDMAFSLNSLGLVAEFRGELDAAEAFYRRALGIYEKLSPGSFPVAGCLNNVGNIAALRRDYATAKDLYQRSLAIRESLGKESLSVAGSINNLGDLARERGDLDEADRLLRRALSLKEKIAPGSMTVAVTLHALGEVRAADGRLAEAEGFHRRALGIWSRLAPGGPDEAGTLRALGGVLLRRRRVADAEQAWRRAVDVLEGIRGQLGGGSDQSGFGAVHAPYYRDLAELLLDQGRAAESFRYLERSRARGLLAMLAERDLVFADEPPQVESRRRRVEAESDRVRARLSRLAPGRDDTEIESLRERLGRLRDERDDVIAGLRAASPRLAALQYPQPLDLAGVRAALDPGTLLLFYSVGKERSFLFTVSAAEALSEAKDGGLAVHRLGIGEDALADRVAVFRGLVDRQREGRVEGSALATQAARLYDLLVGPAQERIEKAQRLLIVADGPLHVLPFAALAPSKRAERTLVEWKPLHTVASATVYAELRKQRRATGAPPGLEVVAFGDPLGRRPLPHSREEVRRIAVLYGPAAAVYVGPDATEERAKALRPGTRYVHFASHGTLDRRFPLESGIELAVRPGATEVDEDGVLHAWEVFERVRLDSDLVTLSACETGLGREWPGEGLVGLARAFQYAGARSVLASLWAVEDRSTAALMDSFYRALRSGLPKDEALRAAQIERSRAGDPALRWAAFQLSGDWR